MCLEMYVVYDAVAEEFSPPFFVKNEIIAYRQFEHALKDAPDMDLYKLFRVGEFWRDSGRTEIYPEKEHITPETVSKCMQLKKLANDKLSVKEEV